MKRNIIISCSFLIAITILFGCVKKEIPLIDSSNQITVNLLNGNKFAVTAGSSIAANPKDSIRFDYVVSSTGRMKYIYVVKNDISGKIFADTIQSNADHYHFTGSKKFMLDSIPGNYFFQIVARDSAGVYVGSSAPVYVSIAPDYTYITNRTIFVPDTAKNNPVYFNIATATAFSYNDVAQGRVNSNQIDFGYYFDTDSLLLTDKKTKAVKGHTIYNLNVSPIPGMISMYDISTFTKNLTYLKKLSVTWASLNSGGALRAAVLPAFKTPPTLNSVNMNIDQNVSPTKTATPAGTVLAFKTADGKYGALTVTFVNQNFAWHSTYLGFEIKLLN